MTDTELRELDVWIIETFISIEIWQTLDGIYPIWNIDMKTGAPFLCPRFSTNAAAFALVKREIERRGWGWTAIAQPAEPPFRFEVHVHGLSVAIYSTTEELAGCLVVRAAVESLA